MLFSSLHILHSIIYNLKKLLFKLSIKNVHASLVRARAHARRVSILHLSLSLNKLYCNNGIPHLLGQYYEYTVC